MTTPLWTDERKQRVMELHTQGWSRTDIGAELGVTRGAVSGVISRWLEKAAAPPPKIPSHKPPPITCDLVSLIDLKGYHCRWPCGDVGSPDFGFCGQPITSRSYCDKHHQMSMHTRQARRAA